MLRKECILSIECYQPVRSFDGVGTQLYPNIVEEFDETCAVFGDVFERFTTAVTDDGLWFDNFFDNGISEGGLPHLQEVCQKTRSKITSKRPRPKMRAAQMLSEPAIGYVQNGQAVSKVGLVLRHQKHVLKWY